MFNTKWFNKLTGTFTVAAFSMLAMQSALAVRVPTKSIPVSDSDVVTAIKNLGYQVEALSVASTREANLLANAVDKELSNILQINTEQSTTAATQDTTEIQNTQSSIQQQLAQFADTALTYTSSTDPVVAQAQTELANQNNLINTLSQGLPASDTIYTAVTNANTGNTNSLYPITKPTVLNDNYFDFNSIFNTDNYNTNQQTAAKSYNSFLFRDYESQTDGLNLDQLRNYLNQFSGDIPTLAQKLSTFRDNQAYKTFQLHTRSNLAAQSYSRSVFTDITTERTPITTSPDPDPKLDTISKLIGVTPTQQQIPDPNNPGQQVTQYTYASPLQISNYMTSWRIKDPKFYQQVAAGSTQDLLRQLVVIMAEVENQNQQTHMDNEKMLAGLAVLNLDIVQSTKATNKTEIGNVNNAITALVSSGNPQPTSSGSQQTTTTPPSTSTDTTGISQSSTTTPTNTTGTPPTTSTTGQ